MAVRASRGATQLEHDEREHLLERTTELVRVVLDENDLSTDDLISIVFTATDDVRSEFPAYAARVLGLVDVPLMCARELDVSSELAVPRCIRVMMHFYGSHPPEAVYLGDTTRLLDPPSPV